MTTHPKKIIDAHCHIGEIPPWKYYDLEHPVKPTVYDYKDTKAFIKNHMDEFKIERALVMSNYGVPIHELSFDLNEVVLDAATTTDRILGAIARKAASSRVEFAAVQAVALRILADRVCFLRLLLPDDFVRQLREPVPPLGNLMAVPSLPAVAICLASSL